MTPPNERSEGPAGPRPAGRDATKHPDIDHGTAEVKGWVDRIRPNLDRAADALMAAGDDLVKAKETLPHGQFGSLLAELGMLRRTAQKLMAIARNQTLRDANHGSHLPSSMTALYELSRLPEEVLEDAIQNGDVTTETTRADAEALRQGPVEQPLSAHEQERLAVLEYAVGAGLERLGEAGGVARLRLLDVLLRGVDDADEDDRLIREVLLSLAIDALDRVPDHDEGDTPVGRLSTAIAVTLRHLWSGERVEAVGALGVLTVQAVSVPLEVRPDVLLQVLDGRSVDEVHPTTRLVVDALLAGFAIEQVSA